MSAKIPKTIKIGDKIVSLDDIAAYLCLPSGPDFDPLSRALYILRCVETDGPAIVAAMEKEQQGRRLLDRRLGRPVNRWGQRFREHVANEKAILDEADDRAFQAWKVSRGIDKAFIDGQLAIIKHAFGDELEAVIAKARPDIDVLPLHVRRHIGHYAEAAIAFLTRRELPPQSVYY
ncbi:hypothetical protein [Nitrospirillum amazonense]|uniref:hypothetical protein n=1 Tax=Nitrospirillum amazonense TaxID=28077 RepID=UPI0024125A8F|nr:hypothetical protein [Nitrospirillum amazonense]MDG3444669.1 hypothetical protein [Nitrospirillum amazonense]